MRRGLWGVLLLAVSAPCAAAPAPAPAPALRVKPTYPTVGEPATVSLTGAGATVKGVKLTVTYRPASQTEATKEVGELGPDGAVRWTPSSPGVTKVVALAPGKKKPIATVTISTRFASAPISGILVLVLAALLLFGGAVLSMWVAMRR